MESPEFLLNRLNGALLGLLGAIEPVNDPALKGRLRDVIRKSVVAEVLSGKWVIAIAGAQGAGKTTLLTSMYELDGEDKDDLWLDPNAGRGERLPVLISEDPSCERPVGVLYEMASDFGQDRYRLRERPVKPAEFRAAIAGDGDLVVLPELRVPPRFFKRPSQAFVLLPGYESLDKSNRAWQALMRQALVNSARCIIVTDGTRMAGEQQEMLKDMRMNQLTDVHPMVVISKTEELQGQPAKREQLIHSAKEMFGIPPDLVDRSIHCIGVLDAEYAKQWKPHLQHALRDIAASGDGARKEQLARLAALLSDELGSVLASAESRSALFGDVESSGGELATSYLEVFDSSVATLRAKYVPLVTSVVTAQLAKARNALVTSLIDSHEGFTNKVLNMFDTVSESERQLETTVTTAWQQAGSVEHPLLYKTRALTAQALGAPAPTAPPNGSPKLFAAPAGRLRTEVVPRDGGPLRRMSQNEVRPNGEDIANLRTLFAKQDEGLEPPTNVSLGVRKTLQLLPPMMLEAMREAALAHLTADVASARLEETLPGADIGSSLRKVQEELGTVATVTQSLIRGLAVVMAVDVGVDGKVDSIPGLVALLTGTGTAPTGAMTGTMVASTTTAATVASALVGGVAVAYLVHSALQEMRKRDGAVKVIAHRMLAAISDRHHAYFLARFDDVMGALRDHLSGCLRTRFHLDEKLAKQDRLIKALADASSLRETLLLQLESSGATMRWFDGKPE